MSVKLEPLGQRVVVKRLMKNETKSGLIVPTQHQKTSMVGRVIHKGPDADWVQEGDIVLFARYSGYEFPVDREYISSEYEDCLIMNCEDIVSKVSQIDTEVK